METILGLKGPDFVMLAADCTQAHSIISLKEGILRKTNKKNYLNEMTIENLTELNLTFTHWTLFIFVL